MAEHFKLPAEVVQPARAFVGLVGLNHVQNAIHRTIWDSFTVSRKQDRLLISFKAFKGNHEYPKANLREPVALECYYYHYFTRTLCRRVTVWGYLLLAC